VIIPRLGRSDYSDPKSFRPISLTSFLLYTLERLIDRYIKERLLQMQPLTTQAYAHDLVILCRGARNSLQGPIARAVQMVDEWCRLAGLSINPKNAIEQEAEL